jgi:glycosyltransferase involved in cell wall biosynthesis
VQKLELMTNPKSIIIIGPAYPLRGGGIATFNERLARAFMQHNLDTSIYTFSLQYPNFLFPGTTQYSTEKAPSDLKIKVLINSINPFNWIKVGNAIKSIKPDIVIVRYWMPFMGPCLGTILRRIKKNKHTKVYCIADNIIPHEKKIIDKPFTKYFIKPIDAFITMSDKVMDDLRLFTTKKAVKVIHPLYDNFGTAIGKTEAQEHLQLNPTKKTILFFGFIRHYKGLDLLLAAIKIIKEKNLPLYKQLQVVIAGEHYGDAKKYEVQIEENAIQEALILHTHFIADKEVKYYLCATDVVIQPYRNATQSGVTPLAYHFEKPMIVTNVGALASNVPHEKVGLVCEPHATAIATAIEKFFTMDYAILLQNIKEEKKKYSWDILVQTFLNLYHDY